MRPTPFNKEDYPGMDFRTAEFPSDSLSIKRLRQTFPQQFDAGGQSLDGYAPFFYPLGADEPEHLVLLASLVSAERGIAVAAFFREYERIHKVEMLFEEDHETIAIQKDTLERNYQYFKLADSPQAARMLIGLVELQGVTQARHTQDRPR
jgi:hypothetical protein